MLRYGDEQYFGPTKHQASLLGPSGDDAGNPNGDFGESGISGILSSSREIGGAAAGGTGSGLGE